MHKNYSGKEMEINYTGTCYLGLMDKIILPFIIYSLFLFDENMKKINEQNYLYSISRLK